MAAITLTRLTKISVVFNTALLIWLVILWLRMTARPLVVQGRPVQLSELDEDVDLPPWVTKEIFFRKLHSASLPSAEVYPYFVRSDRDAMWGEQPAEFSIITMLTLSRFKQLPLLCRRWAGPISATLSINGTLGEAEAQRLGIANYLKELETKHGCAIDVHLIPNVRIHQFNLGRNVARLYARTSHFMLLDVDFVPDDGLREFLENNAADIIAWLDHPTKPRVLVAPALETSETITVLLENRTVEDLDELVPKTKAQAAKMWNEKTVRTFHYHLAHAHWPSNYKKWLISEEPFRVMTSHIKYEPYYIAGPYATWCDERFYGYGANKCACAVELWLAGFEFWVLPNHFVIHLPHGNEAGSSRRKQIGENLQTLSNFVQDMLVKYARTQITIDMAD
jgi:hypothetical protein